MKFLGDMSCEFVRYHSASKDLACSEIGPDLGNLVKYFFIFFA